MHNGPVPPPVEQADDGGGAPCAAKRDQPPTHRSGYRPWRELPRRTFEIDVEHCDRSGARSKLRALVITSAGIERSSKWLGEPTEPPQLAPPRGARCFKSRVIGRRLGEAEQTARFDAD
ncbi:MAG: hypothetical protein OZ921_18335 [Sorangiineae bacterium]|nr:hypothetical protein [Polyangiaceae bacterium]MEB2324479.1 hypothetical protein [Sorangiineae bacterium]